MKKLLAILTIAVMCLAFAGCGGAEEAEVLNPDADDPSLTDEDWALDVWNTAIDKMVAAGEITRSDKEDMIFECQDHEIAYGTPDVKAKYDSSDFKIDEPMIWGEAPTMYTGEPGITIDTFYSDDEGEMEKTPHYLSAYAVNPTPPELFANTRGQCRYLVLGTGIISSIATDFYFGGVDREDVSTYVFVFDAVAKEVVHIHYIDYDSPAAVTSSPTGELHSEGTHSYMNMISQEE